MIKRHKTYVGFPIPSSRFLAMIRTFCVCTASIVLFVLLGSIASCQTTNNPLFSNVRTEIENYLIETGVPSIAVAVARNGEIIWEEGFGLANIEKEIKATPQTLYPLASITKNLTATALMTLVEQGIVRLDQPANLYLGDLKLRAYQGRAEDATVRRLLQHASGLPLYYDAYYEHQLDHKISLEETIRRYGIIISAPGKRFQYSSLGYGIIEYIIEQVSNKSYATFMKEEVFEPLGMTDVLLFDSLPPTKAVAIEYKSKNEPAMFAKGAVRGGGDIYCSVHDLIRYGMFHLKNHLENQEPIISDSLIEMMQMDFDANVKNAEYALGWRIENVSDYRVVSHNGGGLGSDTRLALIPSENLAVAVLANSRAGNSTSICDKIMKTLLTDFTRQSRWEKIASFFKNKKEKKTTTIQLLAGEWMGNITTYKGLVPVKLMIQIDGKVKLRREDKTQTNGDWIESKKKIKLRENNFQVMFDGEILGLEQNRPERYLLLMLQHENDRLYGSANAGNSDELIYCVPSYIEFSRTIKSE